MDFLKVPVKEIAGLIVSGKHELDEVPLTRRSNVEVEVERLKKAIKASKTAEAVVAQVAPEVTPSQPTTLPQPTDDLDTHTVAELRVIAEDYPAITQVIYLRKAELITAIRTARAEVV